MEDAGATQKAAPMDMAINTAAARAMGEEAMVVGTYCSMEAITGTGVRMGVKGTLITLTTPQDGQRQQCRNQAHCNGGRSV